MKTTILAKQITKKHTLKINFLKTQILRFKSSSSSCSKTRSLRVVNCNSNDVCKMNVFSRIFKHTAKNFETGVSVNANKLRVENAASGWEAI